MPEQARWPIVERSALRDEIRRALADDPRRAQLLTGLGGAGKTTLLDELAGHAESTGRRVVPIRGVAPYARVPLGAMLPALAALASDADLGSGVEQRLQLILDRVGREPDRHVVVVDDAQLLDEVSAATVYQLTRVFGVPCLIAARTGEPLPAAIERLRREDLAREHVVEGLAPDQIAEVLERRLGGRAAPDTIDQLWRRTAGNPLFIRGLVQRSLAAGADERSPHGIRLTLDDAGDVTELADRTLETLTPAARKLAQLLALTDGVEVVRLIDTPHAEGLGELREVRLLDESGLTVRLHHPLIVEAARRSLDADPDRAELMAEAVAVLDGDADPLRRHGAVRLLLASGVLPDPERLGPAVAVAHAAGDHETVAELAELAVASGQQGPSLRWDQANSLSLLGRLDESDAAFAAGWAAGPSPEERALGIARHGEHLAFRRFDVAEALALAERASAELPADLRAALAPVVRIWQTIAGHRGGVGPAAPLDVPPALAVRAAMAAVLTDSMQGNPAAARESASTLASIEREFGTLDPQAAAAIHLEEFFRHLAAADGQSAWRVIERQRSAPVTDAAGMWSYTLGVFCSYDGRLAEGARLAALAVDQLRWRDPTGLLGAAIALQATLAASSGDVATARRHLATLRPEQTAEPRAAMLLAEARAWEMFGAGEGAEATEFLVAVCRGALDAGYGLVAALTLSLGIRFGHPGTVLPELDRAAAAAAPGNRLIEALHSLAAGLVGGDPDRVVAAAEVVAAAGMRPTARDGLQAMLTRLPPAGRGEQRRRLARLADRLDAEIGASTLRPARRSTGGVDPGVPTPRERAIAGLAARRLSNDEIAAELGISVRTVENHLSRFYAKTGTDRRTLRTGG